MNTYLDKLQKGDIYSVFHKKIEILTGGFKDEDLLLTHASKRCT